MDTMLPAVRDQLLERFAVLRSAPDLVARLAKEGQLVTVPAGTVIYREGDNCPGLAFVLEGRVRVFGSGPAQREITLYEVLAGETCILNASCLMSGQPYPASATVLEPVTAVQIPASVFQQLVATSFELRGFLFGLFSQRLNEIMELVHEVTFGRLDQRLWDYLVEKSDNQVVHATHLQIANDLGTSREVISRLLKDFEMRGKVRLSRQAIELLGL